jgi:hypothetical protein
MARVDIDEVKEVFAVSATSVLSNVQMEVFINTANMIVTNVLVASGKAYTDAELKEIERYLAAHFCSLRDQRAAAEKFDVLAVTYQGKTGMALDATHYGQTAKLLDRYGVLQTLGDKVKQVSIHTIPSFD